MTAVAWTAIGLLAATLGGAFFYLGAKIDALDRKNPQPEPESERSRLARFAKKLVNVPKKEIDEKAKEWQERKPR